MTKALENVLVLLVSSAVLGGCKTDPYAGATPGTSDAATSDAGGQVGADDAATASSPTDAAVSSDTPPMGTYRISVSANRMLDLVFMVDNSPSMAPKQAKLNAQFPRLLNALKDPTDGTLPDLRVAIIDSDLGTGGAYPSGSCGPKNGSNYGDLGKFQMINAAACSVTSPDSLFLEYKSGAPVNFTGDISKVFACLATNVGTLGCGEEHSLQAFEFALAAKGIGNEAQQQAFLRPNAQLGLVFLTDEDDCSAATNDGMFGVKPGATDLSGESASLRCYTRSHQCNGANLSVTGPGYPTTQAFSAALSSCAARTDACPNMTDGTSGTDTSVPTSCSPLKDIKQLANHLKAIKSSADQIFVAGIFGWPVSDSDMPNAVYKIDRVPNPSQDPAHPTFFDSWPVCYDPSHQPASSAFDVAAAGWGATAGLRNAAFVSEFGTNGMVSSICAADFSSSMASIGSALASRLSHFCIDDVLADVDATTPGLQPDCHVVVSTPTVDPSDTTKIIYRDSAAELPACPAGASNGTVASDCWLLTHSTASCPGNGQLVQLLRPASEVASGPVPPGTQLRLHCQICPNCSPTI